MCTGLVLSAQHPLADFLSSCLQEIINFLCCPILFLLNKIPHLHKFLLQANSVTACFLINILKQFLHAIVIDCFILDSCTISGPFAYKLLKSGVCYCLSCLSGILEFPRILLLVSTSWSQRQYRTQCSSPAIVTPY